MKALPLGGMLKAPTGAVAPRLSWLVALLLAALLTTGNAQPNLVVNGRVIASNDTTLVPGSSYALGASLAQALGATLSVDHARRLTLLQTGGRLIQIRVVDTPAEADLEGAIWLDGQPVQGGAAVMKGGELYLPVKPVSEALGASVTFLQGQNTVMVVQPRGRLTRMAHHPSGRERLELSVSAPVRYSTYYNEPLSTLHIYLERTDIEVRLPTVEGKAFTTAQATSAGGATEVRIVLNEGAEYEVYAVPNGRGFQLNVLLGARRAALGAAARIVLDAGHGGNDPGYASPGFGNESALTLEFVTRLRAALEARGYEVALTRDSDRNLPTPERSRRGVGADLLLSFHVAELPLGEFNAYYLSDAKDVEGLHMAIRENAAGALRAGGTDELRRQLLLGLIPDLDIGRRTAEALAGRLFQNAGYRANSVAGAPLQVLGGAAGRGVLLEFAAADLAAGALPERVAEAVDQLLTDGTIRREVER